MNMNENFDELEARIRNADPAANSTTISDGIVAQAALSNSKKAPVSIRVRRAIFSTSALSAVGALALVASMALPQQPLIRMANTAGAPNAAMADATYETGAKMIWSPTTYEYNSDDLSDQDGSGKVYQLVLTGDPKQKLAQIASYFGLEGEVKEDEWSSEQYPSFSVGQDSRVAGVAWSGTGNWYYSHWDESSMKCEMKTIELEDGSSYESCEPILTPELIPSEAEITSQALTIFNAFGVSASEKDIRVSRSEWGASANLPIKVDGQDSALEWGLSWDGAGKLSYAYGHFAQIQERGSFKTVSPKEAAARITDGRWYGSAPSSSYNLGDGQARIAVGEPAPAISSDASVTTEEPAIEPEVIKLKLTESSPALLMIYDQGGNVWLVPGYLLTNDQGWFDSVISLEEGVIELPEPYDFGVMPMEEAPATKQD